MIRILFALAAGLVFGAGLALSGMSNPAKVLGFLDIWAFFAQGWDPSLGLVMAGGLAVTVPGFMAARSRQRPVAAETFSLPPAGAIDRRLLAGSALFGIGWGLAGICPGPAVTLLVLDGTGGYIFFAAMLAGMLAFALKPRAGT